ncbi:hypothetical protein CcaverHIS002_0203000 [Cutaneotrichosporon cavernicola]|nr:hypothetical protein CcaverHIS002_0203000 [Cutaneotrichosporon cavernicola]BEJ04487.1 hypothetical protein CcaverHIS641_0203040 [Cutaneotrichosporon cavernicola]
MSNLQARKIGTWTQSGSMKDLAAFYALVIKHRWKKGVRFDVNRVTLTAGFLRPNPEISRSLKLAIFERLKDEGQNRIFEDWRRFVEWVSDPELCIIIEGDIEICLVYDTGLDKRRCEQAILFIHKGDLITTDPSSRYPMCQTCIEERVSEKGGTYVRLRRDLSLSPAQIKCVLEHLEARYARDEVAKREHLHRISGGLSSRPRSLSSGSLELVVGLE